VEQLANNVTHRIHAHRAIPYLRILYNLSLPGDHGSRMGKEMHTLTPGWPGISKGPHRMSSRFACLLICGSSFRTLSYLISGGGPPSEPNRYGGNSKSEGISVCRDLKIEAARATNGSKKMVSIISTVFFFWRKKNLREVGVGCCLTIYFSTL
jgi:hypothetical protein